MVLLSAAQPYSGKSGEDICFFTEPFGVCDRIAVMSREVLSEPRAVEMLTPEKFMQLAVGEEYLQDAQ